MILFTNVIKLIHRHKNMLTKDKHSKNKQRSKVQNLEVLSFWMLQNMILWMSFKLCLRKEELAVSGILRTFYMRQVIKDNFNMLLNMVMTLRRCLPIVKKKCLRNKLRRIHGNLYKITCLHLKLKNQSQKLQKFCKMLSTKTL